MTQDNDHTTRNQRAGSAKEAPAETPDPLPINEAAERHLDYLQRHLVLPEGAAPVLVLWSLHTHLYGQFDCTPRLLISSAVAESGKSSVLDTLDCTCSEALFAGCFTGANVYRTVDDIRGNKKRPPTFLIDEADMLNRQPDLVTILKHGFRKRGSVVPRQEKNEKTGNLETKLFNAFAPAALAMIGRPSDWALVSRSILIPMTPGTPPAKHTDEKVSAELDVVGQSYAAWAANIDADFPSQRPELPDGLDGRRADIYTPLFAIAEALGGEWPERLRHAVRHLEDKMYKPDRKLTLLWHIKALFNETGSPYMSPMVLRDKLCERWPDVYESEGDKRISPRWIRDRLEGFLDPDGKQIGTRSKRAPREYAECVGVSLKDLPAERSTTDPRSVYCRADFEDAWEQHECPQELADLMKKPLDQAA